MINSNISAQGTIEYLVIIAVVVVISLIVVVLFVNMSGSSSQQIIDSSSNLGTSSSGGISVVEAVLDLDGDSLIRLNNTSSDAITLTRVSVGGVDNEYFEQVVGMDSKVISLSGLSSGCACASGQKNVKCEYIITYVQNGITKTARINKTIECVSDSTPVDSGKVVGLGSGTLLDPWIINNCQELQDMNLHLDGNYALGADINCYTDTRIGGALYNGGAGFKPIGTSGTPFRGSFNGNNKIISNLRINLPLIDDVGFFGYSNGNISSVGLTNISITGKWRVGGLIGDQNRGTITNSFSTGSVTGGYFVGGLVGYQISGAINNSYSDSIAYSTLDYTGGLVGGSKGTITNSYSTGNVDGVYSAGGLVGWMNGGIITNSYSIGGVEGAHNGVGGLVGSQSIGTITNSYSTGVVNDSGSYVGGFMGQKSATVSDCGWWTGSFAGNAIGTPAGNITYNQASKSDFYGQSLGIYSTWTFGADANWTARDNNYPILSWQ